MHHIKNKNSNVTVIEGDIFYVIYDKGVVIKVADFEETESAYQKLSQGKKMKFLVEFPKFVSATAEARKWAELNQVDAYSEAIIFYNLGQKMLIRFYLLFRKQTHPVRTFSKREMAIEWLKSMN
ncbi:MAG: hypothetical protein GQ574_08810 [Crocinitomix sp.]|nr:hypothetical protein [Crocinitomix sp.]